MTDRNTAKPAQIAEAVRAAQRTLNDAVETAKQLKAKARDAKRRVKIAKKAAKKASKDSRAARKAAEQARRLYKKALARATKDRSKAAKAAKKVQRIVTPKHTSRSRNDPQSRRRPERAGARERSRQRSWEVGEDGDGATRPEPATAS